MTLKNTKGYVIIESVSDGDKLTQKCECSVYEKEASVIVFYTETEESLAGDVKTSLKITGKTVNLVRRGTYSSNMWFEEGVAAGFRYNMPYGHIDMSLTTKKLDVKKTPGKLEIRLEYDLFNGSDNTKNIMKITIEMGN